VCATGSTSAGVVVDPHCTRLLQRYCTAVITADAAATTAAAALNTPPPAAARAMSTAMVAVGEARDVSSDGSGLSERRRSSFIRLGDRYGCGGISAAVAVKASAEAKGAVVVCSSSVRLSVRYCV
jgi:hypothetical protein